MDTVVHRGGLRRRGGRGAAENRDDRYAESIGAAVGVMMRPLVGVGVGFNVAGRGTDGDGKERHGSGRLGPARRLCDILWFLWSSVVIDS